jgi:PAS domain-containing protein
MDEGFDPKSAPAEAIAEAIFEAIADPVFVIDFVGDDLGTGFRYANDAACRLLKRSRAEILKLRPGTLDDIPDSVREAAYHKLVTEGRATFETLLIAADGCGCGPVLGGSQGDGSAYARGQGSR